MPTLQFSNRTQGDFRVDGEPDQLAARRARAASGTWTWLRQVHGNRVVTVTEAGEHAGVEADAAVTDAPDAVLAIHTADCAPVLLYSGSVLGAAHVGWQGLVSGVLEATVAAMTHLGAGEIHATVGPHIHARCYEFGAQDLDRVADCYGDTVRSTTAWGTPALDLRAGIRASFDAMDTTGILVTQPGCTACEPDRFYSHRARGDVGRHASLIRHSL